jgi:SpoVK/Ycf46/Vps4 family AAA+-type ATPase
MLMTSDHFRVGAVEYVTVPVGPGKTLACVELAVLLVSTPDGPVGLLVNRAHEHHEGPPLAVQAASPVEGHALAFLADLRERMDANDVYRGQLITVEVTRHGSHRIVFLERPVVAPEDVILPDGALDHVERHVLGPTRHRDALVAQGRHLSRGLLLWGPPGTGKTHTVRYLTGRLHGATTLLLSGASLGMLSAFATLARRLAPSVVVLDDVDLIAQERTYGPFGESSSLFELMNQMSGLAEDADVAFVLTTNRPDALEPALAARPGRVDLAIEVPLPDSAARRRLLDLYGRGLNLELQDPEAVVARTDGVTASFVKELLRRAALDVAEAGRATVTDHDVTVALDELLGETGALTRAFLGVRQPGDPEPTPDPHGWMRTWENG